MDEIDAIQSLLGDEALSRGGRTVDWFELKHPSECYGPALYRLRLVDAEGRPIPIPTMIDGHDPSGIMDIGEGGNFETRRNQIISGVEKCYGHSAGNLFRYLCLFTRIQEVHPGCRLQYTFRPATSKAEAEDWEAEAIKEYIIRRGQLPILNRELPRAYNDVVWNSVWQRVFGPVTDAPAVPSTDEVVAPNRTHGKL